MTAPGPEERPVLLPAAMASAETAGRRRVLLARKWAYVISTTAYLPLTHSEVEQLLLHLVDPLVDAVRGDPFDPTPAARVGARLVEIQCVGHDSVRRTVEVLGTGLLQQPELTHVPDLTERVMSVLGELMAGYSEALRQAIQRRQESLSQSLFTASKDERRTRPIGPARFAAVFHSSATGIAVADLGGHFREVNEALTRILGRSAADLAGLTMFDVVDPEDAGPLRDTYDHVRAGRANHLRHACRLPRGHVDEQWLTITVSLIRDGEGSADHVVLVVEADDEISLLQRRLTHQSLHDALTGLPNRQFFRARLENALRHAGPDPGITLYHLDLDGFALVKGGLGYETGDRLLKTVAERLSAAVAGEQATVARLEGDEFGILIENTPSTPDVIAMIDRFNDELSEPVYVDGEHGLATSVSIGVVHRPDARTPPAELLRAAEMTVRRAKSEGPGQWALFDPAQDERDRETFGLAASMPGAWETGQISVSYRPVVQLADDRQVGVEAVLAWNHPRHGRLAHEMCVTLAERTGLILPLGNWLLSSGCAHVRSAGNDPRLSVTLTENQAADPDLVGSVRRTLDQAGLPPQRLELLFPASTLLPERGETLENLTLLADIGIRTAVHTFGAGDVTCLESLPVAAIRIAPQLVTQQAERPGTESAISRMLHTVVEIAHHAGAQVSVDGINTPAQAGFWREAGADLALGKLFPPPGPS